MTTIFQDENVTQSFELSKNERLKIVILQFGNDDYQTDITVDLVGENASVEVYGLSFASYGNNGTQSLKNTIQVNHIAPNCTSNVLYKYVLKDGGRTDWVGNVTIQKGAKGTQTYEENRNLLLTPGSRALSLPNLEILEGDIISAGHASATGRFDDEQLFYLQSRGIDEEQAKRLVVEGFFAEVLEKLDLSDEILAEIRCAIERKLSAQSGLPSAGNSAEFGENGLPSADTSKRAQNQPAMAVEQRKGQDGR